MKLIIIFIFLFLNVSVFGQIINPTSIEKDLHLNNNYEQSILEYKNQLINKNGNAIDIAQRLINALILMAQNQNSKGDFNNAEIHLNEAFLFYKKYQLRAPELECYLLQNKGYNYILQENYPDAIKNYEKALKVVSDTSYLFLGSILRNIGDIHTRQHNFILSEPFYKKAIDILSDRGGTCLKELNKVYQNYGWMLIEIGAISKGEKILTNSYKSLFQIYGQHDKKTIFAANYLGYLYLTNNQFLKAIQYFQKSINGIQEELIDRSIYATPKIEDLEVNTELLYALKYKAQAFYLLYTESKKKEDILASIATYTLTIALVDKAKLSFLNEESLLGFTKSYKSSIINNAVSVLYEAYELTKDEKYKQLMFEYSEKGKASLLSNSLEDFTQKSLSGLSKTLIDQEASLKNEISVLKAKIQNQLQADSIRVLETQLFEKMDLLNSVKRTVKEELDILNIDLSEIHPVEVSEIQERLKDNEILVEYTLTGYHLYTFTITDNSFEVQKSIIDSVFYSNIKNFRNTITQNDFVKSFDEIKPFKDLSHRLYLALIKPIEAVIEGKHLIIVPEEELLYVPFDILCKSQWKKGENFRSLKYLIHDHPISYNYSSTLRFKLRKSLSNPNDEILSYAPIYNFESSGLEPLPFAQEEVSYINSLFSSSNITGEYATEHHFKTYARDYKYLHLSMHSSINEENSIFSNLFFSDDTNSTEDGKLEINELYREKINSDLVVLSGCRTGDGKLYKGEGLYSLSRGFMHAGCPNITLTMWDVNDESSYHIIHNYYKYLSEGLTNDIALQRSKIDYLKQASSLNALPFFWASYMILGDNNLVIEQSNNLNLLLWLLGTSLLIGLIILGIRKFLK